MYEASGSNIYVNTLDGGREIFLTVFQTTSIIEPEEQAAILAEILNERFD